MVEGFVDGVKLKPVATSCNILITKPHPGVPLKVSSFKFYATWYSCTSFCAFTVYRNH